MKKKISLLAVAYTTFFVLLFLSGSIDGLLSDAVYYLAFIIPFVIVIIRSQDKISKENYFQISSENIKFTLPLILPTVVLVMLISALTSLILLALTGKTNTPDVGNSLWLALFLHALLPAVLEELLFRYLPLRLLAPHSKRCAVLLSANFFSLIHHNFFVIPYAFVAGALFMMIDIASGSIIPSILIHFINNALSVGLLVCSDNPAFAPIIYILLGVGTFISLVLIFTKRRLYFSKLSSAFEKGDGVKITAEMLIFAGLTLMIATLGLIWS